MPKLSPQAAMVFPTSADQHEAIRQHPLKLYESFPTLSMLVRPCVPRFYDASHTADHSLAGESLHRSLRPTISPEHLRAVSVFKP